MEALIFAQIDPAKLPNNSSDWPIYSIIAVILALIGWGIDSIRKRSEIAKLNSEVTKLNAEVSKLKTEEIKLAGDFLKELQHYRDLYADACVVCTQHAQTLIGLLQSSADKDLILTTRDLFCKALTREALYHYCALAEWNALSRKHSIDQLLYYIRSDVTAELDRISRWIDVVNLPMFLDGYGSQPLLISEQTMRPFFDILRFVPDDNQSAIKAVLYSSIRKLTKE